MASRNVPGAGDKPAPARRVVPGAPPPAPSKSAKKGKGPGAKTADASAVKVPDATSAVLIETAPEGPKQVANGLKVTSQDLAEQAEAQAAVAAVEAVQASSSNTTTTQAASTPAQKVIADRIAELSSKPKNATITVAIDELNSLLANVQQAESTAEKPASADSKSSLVLLLQFLHLFNLFHPNPAEPPSFAPKHTMPPALEMSTGQQVAAVAKVYDQLANGPLEGDGGDALEILANIEKGSNDQVLPDVSYATLRSMILKLTAPPEEPEPEPQASALDGPPKDFVPLSAAQSPSAAPVSFIQASEILDASSPAPAQATKGHQGGEKTAPTWGTTASAAKEPAPEPKLNWAALAEEDDDDLGEAPVFEPLPSSTTSALVTPAPGTPTETSTPAAAGKTESTPLSPKPNKKNKQNTSKGGRSGNAANGKPQQQQQQQKSVAQPTPKAQPKVDQDGFILQESKRTRYLQQKQQQQQQQQQQGRGGGGGGKSGGGNKGGAGGGKGGRSANGSGNGGGGRVGARSNNNGNGNAGTQS